MTDPRRIVTTTTTTMMLSMTSMTMTVLILLTTLLSSACVSASSRSAPYFNYPGNFPIVFFSDFKYIPTDYGYKLSYRTQAGVFHEELGIVPGIPPLRNNGDFNSNSNSNSDSNPDTLGSSRSGRGPKSNRLPTKTRKVSPKLLASLSG